MTKPRCRHLKTVSETILSGVMMCVRFRLFERNVEVLFHERCNKTFQEHSRRALSIEMSDDRNIDDDGILIIR